MLRTYEVNNTGTHMLEVFPVYMTEDELQRWNEWTAIETKVPEKVFDTMPPVRTKKKAKRMNSGVSDRRLQEIATLFNMGWSNAEVMTAEKLKKSTLMTYKHHAKKMGLLV